MSGRAGGAAGNGTKRAAAALSLASLIAAVGVAASGCGGSSPATTGTTASRPPPPPPSGPDLPARVPALEKQAKHAPNLLFVLVDDQAENTFKPRFEPNVFRWIVDPGTRFPNGVAAPPLCCPDRAGVASGQFPHNHGVFSNKPGYADFEDKEDTLPVWLYRAGYKTALFGKYMNGYPTVAGLNSAPGFEKWLGFRSETRYYNYSLTNGRRLIEHGRKPRDYSTDVFTRRAVRFIHSTAKGKRPFFLWLSYFAPHDDYAPRGPCKSPNKLKGNWNPVPRSSADFKRYAHVKLPEPPSYDERHIQDKIRAVAQLPRITLHLHSHVAARYRCTLAALHPVDQGVGQMMQALRREGELRNTVVVYLSDNGVYYGEHRLLKGKGYAYEPALNVPYAIRVPPWLRRGPQPPSVSAVVSNQDIAPTFLDYAGLAQRPPVTCARGGDCRVLDGRTIEPLLGGAGSFPPNRGVIAEIKGYKTDYHAIRTPRDSLIETEDGERELFDLRSDPYELHNIAGKHSRRGLERSLAARLRRLKRCSGIRGRDHNRPGVPFCE